MDGMEAFEVFGQMAFLEIFRPTGALEVDVVWAVKMGRVEKGGQSDAYRKAMASHLSELGKRQQ